MTSNIDKDLTALVKLAKVQEKALAVTMKKIEALKKKIEASIPKEKYELPKYELGYIVGAKEGEFGSKTYINWYDDK
jgi:methylglyoxal synthase